MKKINLCEYCGKGRDFFEDEKFKNHTCRNKNEVFCKDCEKCFASNLILRIHIEAVHKGMLYTCKECQKKFKSLASMKRHLKTHKQSIKNHACDTCEKEFTRNQHLKNHMKEFCKSMHFQSE